MNNRIKDHIHQITSQLEVVGISSARLESIILIEDAIGKDRSWILAHPEEIISEEVSSRLKEQTARRAEYEPLSYIRGKSEFYGREFAVTPATLQPRPETETMIDLLKSLELPNLANIADIGTGSGAIIITSKLELPHTSALATDIQPDALAIAQINAKAHQAEVTFFEGNLLDPLQKLPIDVILANLPYVPDNFEISKAATKEPATALFGGEDGLDLYREMFAQIEQHTSKPSYILTESLTFQHPALTEIALSHGYMVTKSKDLIQLFEPVTKA